MMHIKCLVVGIEKAVMLAISIITTTLSSTLSTLEHSVL